MVVKQLGIKISVFIIKFNFVNLLHLMLYQNYNCKNRGLDRKLFTVVSIKYFTLCSISY